MTCVLFATKDNLKQLITVPFRKWTKVSDLVGGHEKLPYHMDAVVAARDFKATMKTGKTIATPLDRQRYEHVTNNNAILHSIAESVLLLGRQGLAFMGHRDDSTADEDSNKGNFLALLSFQGKS